MSKHFRPWNIDQTLLLPPNVRDFVPKDHVSRFIVGLVRDSLDLKAIMGSYVSGLGQPPFDPRMMVSLLLHGYASGLYSSRRIARACCERNDFVMIPWLLWLLADGGAGNLAVAYSKGKSSAATRPRRSVTFGPARAPKPVRTSLT
jgi:Transposase domain (DUF772)